MTQPAGTPADDILLVLDESLPVIRAALVHYYGYEPSEAEAFNDTLAVWFHRVIRRAGNRVLSARELREQLLFVACKYARAFRLAKARTGDILNDHLNNVLNRPPEEVALALLDRIHPMGSPS
jgi:hypothetical protein